MILRKLRSLKLKTPIGLFMTSFLVLSVTTNIFSPTVAYAVGSDGAEIEQAKVLCGDKEGDITSVSEYKELITAGSSLLSSSAVVDVGSDIKLPNNKYVPLRLVMFKPGTNQLADSDGDGYSLNTYTQDKGILSASGDVVDNAKTGSLTLEGFCKLMESDYGVVYSEDSVNIGLVATIDGNAGGKLTQHGADTLLTVSDVEYAIETDSDLDIWTGTEKVDTSKGNEVKPDEPNTPTYVVARYNLFYDTTECDLKENFTMALLYDVVSYNIKQGKLDGADLFGVDLYGNIVTSTGKLVLPFFCNSNFVDKPLVDTSLISSSQIATDVINSKEDDFNKATVKSDKQILDSYESRPMYIGFVETDDGEEGLLFKKGISDGMWAKLGASLKDSAVSAITGTNSKTGNGTCTAAIGDDYFDDLGWISRGSMDFSKYMEVSIGGEWIDTGINYNSVTPASSANFAEIFEDIADDSTADKYSEFYKVMYADNQYLMDIGSGNEALGGTTDSSNSNELFMELYQHPYRFIAKTMKQWSLAVYDTMLKSTPESIETTSSTQAPNIIVFSGFVTKLGIFTWYAKSCYMLAAMATSIVILIAFFKKLRGSADSFTETVASVVLVYLCIVGPVYIYPVIVDFLFDKPSLMMLSNITDRYTIDAIDQVYSSGESEPSATDEVEASSGTITDNKSANEKAITEDFGDSDTFTITNAKPAQDDLKTSFVMRPARHTDSDISFGTYLSSDPLSLLCQQSVANRFTGNTLKIDTEYEITTDKEPLSEDSQINIRDLLLNPELSMLADSEDDSDEEEDENTDEIAEMRKDSAEIYDPFEIHEILRIYADEFENRKIDTDKGDYRFFSTPSAVVRPLNSDSSRYDEDDVNTSTCNRIIIDVNKRIYKYFTINGECKYETISANTLCKLIGGEISMAISKEAGGNYSYAKCTNLSTDEFMRSLFMTPQQLKNTAFRNNTEEAREKALITYICSQSTVIGLALFDVFVILLGVYSVIRCVALVGILIGGSVCLLVAYPLNKDYRNKAILGIGLSLLILAVGHMLFLLLCRLIINLIAV